MWDPYGNAYYQQNPPTSPYYQPAVYFPMPMVYPGPSAGFSPPAPSSPWATQGTSNAYHSEAQHPQHGPEAIVSSPSAPAPRQQRGRRIIITTSHHHTVHLTRRHSHPHHNQGHSHPTSHSHSHSHSHLPSRSRTRPEPEGASIEQVDRVVASQHAKSHSHAPAIFSRCTGRKKALCIGINYTGQHNELHGCVNDARNVRRFLTKYWNFRPEDVFLLTDDAAHGHQQPTRANILEGMRWLVRDACPHDSLVFHYSGHGGQTRDLDGDEVDGLDEVIFPVDYRHAGHIVDDEMHHIMVRDLPNGCRLTALFDSCHSGSALDLPYLYHSDGKVKGLSEVTPSHLKEKTTKADVISWSGCMDSQTSADTFKDGAAVGAMSYAFMKTLTENKTQSYQQLLQHLRAILKKNYSQKPQLSSSHRINTNSRFIM
ncbi:hypothetical protein DAEQUDRAFT_764030 [Daedalea quercina L-15889]|uniref:Peptidase C14 caspase domain-containing protein n=1 Tax=Daedalea quercina L-15889 TaxID=1314783 RepID=A0A165RRZ2_9APHY|nr:hypothetical protein DAEQUDRAFT_764030 [Daedalea quercina L-15889]